PRGGTAARLRSDGRGTGDRCPGRSSASGHSGRASPRDHGLTRQTWKNYIGSLVAQPLQVFAPTTLDELRSIVRQAAAEGCRIKAVGSGHSFTDVALTRDFLIDTHGLSHPLDLERDLLRPSAPADTLFATEGGIVVRDLNEALWEAGLGLVNMGGYDGQTI